MGGGQLWAETVTLTTYLPAPIGAYDQLKLNPNYWGGSPPSCATGDFSVDDSDLIQYCIAGTWSLIPGVWTQTDDGAGDPIVFPSDFLSNPVPNLNIGIGTITPNTKLQIHGNVNVDWTSGLIGGFDFLTGEATVINEDVGFNIMSSSSGTHSAIKFSEVAPITGDYTNRWETGRLPTASGGDFYIGYSALSNPAVPAYDDSNIRFKIQPNGEAGFGPYLGSLTDELTVSGNDETTAVTLMELSDSNFAHWELRAYGDSSPIPHGFSIYGGDAGGPLAERLTINENGQTLLGNGIFRSQLSVGGLASLKLIDRSFTINLFGSSGDDAFLITGANEDDLTFRLKDHSPSNILMRLTADGLTNNRNHNLPRKKLDVGRSPRRSDLTIHDGILIENNDNVALHMISHRSTSWTNHIFLSSGKDVNDWSQHWSMNYWYDTTLSFTPPYQNNLFSIAYKNLDPGNELNPDDMTNTIISFDPTLTFESVAIGQRPNNHPLSFAGGAHVTSAGEWKDVSSRESKTNIEDLDLTEALTAFKHLAPVTFNYKTKDNNKRAGFIAEDVPDLLSQKDHKGLSAMDIVALLTKVMQHQKHELDKQQEFMQGQQQKLHDIQKMLNTIENRGAL